MKTNDITRHQDNLELLILLIKTIDNQIKLYVYQNQLNSLQSGNNSLLIIY